LTEKFKSELQIINVLQALDKYLIHLRKLKHLKNETVKANIVAAREAQKTANAVKASKVSEVPQNQAAKTTEEVKDVKLKSNSKKSIKSAEEQNKENNANVVEAVETAPCKDLSFLTRVKKRYLIIFQNLAPSVQESVKEEDLLVNIASKLVLIIESGSQVRIIN